MDMLDLTRRHVLAALAVPLAGLDVRRAAALPAAPLPVPPPAKSAPRVFRFSRLGYLMTEDEWLHYRS